MSVLDDLRVAQQRVTDRLAELEPLVKEYEELRTAAEQLNLTNGTATPAKQPAKASRRKPAKRSATKTASGQEQTTPAAAKTKAEAKASGKTSTTKTAGRSRKRAGQRGTDRATDIQRLVSQNPGITVAAIGKELGVDPTSLYRPVKRLIAQGKLNKDGRELQPR